MARLIAVVPDPRQVGALIDSLRAAGFDRQDMVVSDLRQLADVGDAQPNGGAYVKTEREELVEQGPFAETVADLLPDWAEAGLVVAVEASKHELGRVRAIMEQNGATRILEG